MSGWSYDYIADVYETDMGSNLPFDDIGYYAQACRSARGRALELGCGTGRITLPLLRDGIDLVGIDRSWPMLRRLADRAALLGVPARAICMDARDLAFATSFSIIFAPFSMIVYVTDEGDLSRLLMAARALLEPDGRLLLDAFVPREVSRFATFQEDYDRPHGFGRLARCRRITPLGDGRNKIERRYRLTGSGVAEREWTTVDIIRPFTAEMLAAAAEKFGFALEYVDHNYGQGSSSEPDFATVVLRAREAGGRRHPPVA